MYDKNVLIINNVEYYTKVKYKLPLYKLGDNSIVDVVNEFGEDPQGDYCVVLVDDAYIFIEDDLYYNEKDDMYHSWINDDIMLSIKKINNTWTVI